jgi:adenosylmethionine-8-amino-7-oxononanoate aminotransferase
VMCAIALKNIEIMKRERILEHVARTRTRSGQRSRSSSTSRSSATSADGLLLGDRARQGQGHARDVLGGGVRAAPARLPLDALWDAG